MLFLSRFLRLLGTFDGEDIKGINKNKMSRPIYF